MLLPLERKRSTLSQGRGKTQVPSLSTAIAPLPSVSFRATRPANCVVAIARFSRLTNWRTQEKSPQRRRPHRLAATDVYRRHSDARILLLICRQTKVLPPRLGSASCRCTYHRIVHVPYASRLAAEAESHFNSLATALRCLLGNRHGASALPVVPARPENAASQHQDVPAQTLRNRTLSIFSSRPNGRKQHRPFKSAGARIGKQRSTRRIYRNDDGTDGLAKAGPRSLQGRRRDRSSLREWQAACSGSSSPVLCKLGASFSVRRGLSRKPGPVKQEHNAKWVSRRPSHRLAAVIRSHLARATRHGGDDLGPQPAQRITEHGAALSAGHRRAIHFANRCRTGGRDKRRFHRARRMLASTSVRIHRGSARRADVCGGRRACFARPAETLNNERSWGGRLGWLRAKPRKAADADDSHSVLRGVGS
ncbi:hypothetical protein RJ55_01858 [Drechmeria coniospora]|nr:hypothetical protein RJ55_01858 [Drechmeria coniospora]